MGRKEKQLELAHRIGKNMRKYRGERKQADIANEVSKRTGSFDVTTYSNYERGKRLPELDVLFALSDIYGVSIDDLCRADDGKKIVTAESFLRMITSMYENSRYGMIEINTNAFNHYQYPGYGDEEITEWDQEAEDNNNGNPIQLYNATITINEPYTGKFLSVYAPIAETVKANPGIEVALDGTKEKLFSQQILREIVLSGRKGQQH